MALAVAGLLGLGVGAGTGTALAARTVASADAADPRAGAESIASRPPGPEPSQAAEPAMAMPAAPSAAPEPAPLAPAALTSSAQTPADLAAGVLSPALPTSASGELVVVPGSVPAPDPAAASVRTVRVEVERGLDIDPAAFASMVMATLNDPRGWGAGGTIGFARTDADAQIRVVLAAPDLVDTMCAPLATNGVYSCGRNDHAVLNHTRWVAGTSEFPDVTVYRQYVVNHEVGHLLGHPHVSCPGAGRLAPLMQQQTVRVAPCLPNAWPFPDGA